jgi:putative protein kinase ArgK-like GTPase of G3E family
MRIGQCWFLTNTIIVFLLLQVHCNRGDDYSTFVQEVLDEHDQHYHNKDDPYGYRTSGDDDDDAIASSYHQQNSYEDEMRRKVEDEEIRRLAEQQRLEQELYDKIQKEREEQFEAELARMTKEKQQAAKKQKTIDAEIVKQVLHAARNDDHYSVLGLWNIEMKIPERTIQVPIIKYSSIP